MSLVSGIIARLIIIIEYTSSVGRLDLAGEDFGPGLDFLLMPLLEA